MNEHTTRDGIEVKPGQLWKDCDKRMRGRSGFVQSVSGGKAVIGIGATGRTTRIAIRRMYRHSSGWVMVRDENRKLVGAA